MNKRIKKYLIFSFFLAFLTNSVNASLLWDVNYAINQYRKNNFKSAKEYLIEYTKNTN